MQVKPFAANSLLLSLSFPLPRHIDHEYYMAPRCTVVFFIACILPNVIIDVSTHKNAFLYSMSVASTAAILLQWHQIFLDSKLL